MRVLVTGGAGFIGSYVLRELLARRDSIDVLDDLSSGKRENLVPGARLTVGDIRDVKKVGRLLKSRRIEGIVHLAAQMNVRVSIQDPLFDASVNVMGGVGLLKAAAEAGVRRLVFASSGGAIYGDQKSYPCTEETVPGPASPYGAAKFSVEQYAKSFTSPRGLQVTNLRLANVYGPRQDPRGEAGVIAIFAQRMLRGEVPTVFGDGRQTRDYVFAGDVARAFVRALRGRPGTYNVGTGRETSVNGLVREIVRLTAYAGKVNHGPAVPGEVRRNSLDCRRIGRALGWKPRVPLPEGIRRTVAWFQEEAR